MTTEIIFLGHDNTIDLILKADDVAQDLANVTRITATFADDTYVNSTDKATGDITWDQVGYDTGEIRLELGAVDITPGEHKDVPIVVYDPDHADGLLWGYQDFEVIKDPEGST